jgi:integrase
VWEADGKREQRTFSSKEAAEVFGAEKRLDLRQAKPATEVSPGITVRDFAQLWLTEVAPGLKPRTVVSYRQMLDNHILPALGAVEVRELHQGVVADLLAGKLLRFKVGTVRLIYATLRRLLSRAVFRGVIKNNPAAQVWKELPIPPAKRRVGRRRTPSQVPAMTEQELRQTLDAATKYRALFVLLAYSGLRIGEALALRPDDLDEATIQVRHTLAPVQKGVNVEDRLGTPKSDECRAVAIGQHLSRVLREHLASERERHFKSGRPFSWLFSTREGLPLDEARVRKLFKAAVKAAGLPAGRFTVHSLRHTYASQMLAKGAPITWVSKQLGHAHVTTTLDFYSWALPQGDSKLASLLDPVTTRDQSGAVGADDAT